MFSIFLVEKKVNLRHLKEYKTIFATQKPPNCFVLLLGLWGLYSSNRTNKIPPRHNQRKKEEEEGTKTRVELVQLLSSLQIPYDREYAVEELAKEGGEDRGPTSSITYSSQLLWVQKVVKMRGENIVELHFWCVKNLSSPSPGISLH